MAFRFSLDTLLRVREIDEQREERLLGQILNQITQTYKTLADLAVQRRAMITQRESSLQQQTSAAELMLSYERIRANDEMVRTGQHQLVKLHAMKDQQMKVYETAHSNREVLSTMREKQREHYKQDQSRKEQSMMDDNFSSRRARK